MPARWGIWCWSIAILAILVGLVAIARWAILDLVHSEMDGLDIADLPKPELVSGNSPALSSLFFELAGVRYKILIPKHATVKLPSGRIDFVEIWHPNTTRLMRMFRLGPASDSDNRNEKYAWSEKLPNGAVLRYNVNNDIGGGSGGTEGELKGRLEIGTRVLAVTCRDQDELTTPSPYRVCVPYLHHLRID